MNSTEKVWALIEHLADADDDELAEAFPIALPPTMMRAALAMAGEQLPQAPAELDAFLEGVSAFCLTLRSDPPGETPQKIAIEAGDG